MAQRGRSATCMIFIKVFTASSDVSPRTASLARLLATDCCTVGGLGSILGSRAKNLRLSRPGAA